MYTRQGDKGETGLYGPRRVQKDSKRVDAYGTVDELNSYIGIAISAAKNEKIIAELKWVQGRLFVAGADLASEMEPVRGEGKTREGENVDEQKEVEKKHPGPSHRDTAREQDRVPRISKLDIDELERMIDELQPSLSRLTVFILPGGSTLSAHLHFARAVCRRAERSVVSLGRVEGINPQLIPFLNRLSTLLFNLARYSNVQEGRSDEPWEKGSSLSLSDN